MNESKPKTLKVNNRKLVLNKFISAHSLTVSDIQKDIALSKTTLAKIISHLQENDLIIATGKSLSTDEGGRRAIQYEFNAQYAYCVSIHVFPDSLYGVITDLNLNVKAEKSIIITSDISFDAFVSNIVVIIQDLCLQLQIPLTKLAGVAIGLHGLTDKSGAFIYSPHFKLLSNQQSLIDTLKQTLPNIPLIFADNQIRYQVLAEQTLGHARTRNNFVIVEAGIGLVTGIFLDGHIKHGKNNIAGEIGHMILAPESGEQCKCGAIGCFETLVSEKRLVRIAREKKKDFPQSLIFRNDLLTLTNIISAYKNGDCLAKLLMDEAAYWFARGFINIFLTIDPEEIIIQGLYAQAGETFTVLIQEKIQQLLPMMEKIKINISTSKLDKTCGAIGGAILVKDKFIESLDFN